MRGCDGTLPPVVLVDEGGIGDLALLDEIRFGTEEVVPVEETLLRAVDVATSEMPGPVHIGLPSDLGTMKAVEDSPRDVSSEATVEMMLGSPRFCASATQSSV